VVVAANVLVTAGLWFRHGGLAAASGPGGRATAAGELTALLGTDAVLLQLLLMARVPWLERAIGFDRLAVWHRWNGFAAVWLLLAHTILTTVGYARGTHTSFVGQTRDFLWHYADVPIAYVGLLLFLAVGITSVRAIRRSWTRERWYLVHLSAYLAVALAFAHQLAVGTDLSGDRAARIWWVTLYLAVAVSIVAWRVGRPVRLHLRHRLRVVAVEREAPGVASITIGGHHLDELDARAGQFLLWRFRHGRGWWHAHPFSLSAAPVGDRLRITVKALGDRTTELLRVPVGTRIYVEGPFGTFTSRRRQRERAVLIGGGIGITPLRALLDELPDGPGQVTVVHRIATKQDGVFANELTDLTATRGYTLHTLVGTEIGDDRTDRLGVSALRELVPDLTERDCYLCGPPGFVDAVRRRLHRIGVPADQIHAERFEL
jgi:predicted ferric reductase